MKKKILGVVAILGIAIVTAIHTNFSSSTNFSNILLQNIEALANGEGGPSSSMTEAEYARLGCKPTIRIDDRCKANNGLVYYYAINI